MDFSHFFAFYRLTHLLPESVSRTRQEKSLPLTHKWKVWSWAGDWIVWPSFIVLFISSNTHVCLIVPYLNRPQQLPSTSFPVRHLRSTYRVDACNLRYEVNKPFLNKLRVNQNVILVSDVMLSVVGVYTHMLDFTHSPCLACLTLQPSSRIYKSVEVTWIR